MWIPIGLMGCVHTHKRRFVIERCDRPNHIQNIMKKIGENNQKVGKTSRAINQTPTPRPKLWQMG
jgi:hypothetical protein